MKRLTKNLQKLAAWMSVCLLLVDPAAACRFRERRCCNPCPDACQATSCIAAATQTVEDAPAASIVIDVPVAPPPEVAVETAPPPVEVTEPIVDAPPAAVLLPDQKVEPKAENPPLETTPTIDFPAPVPATAEPPKQLEPDPNDPFAPLPVKPRETSAPATSTPGPTKSDDSEDLSLRQWTDDSGQFRIAARLMKVFEGKVRLLKATGRTTTVPLARLSAMDRAYVTKMIARYGNDLGEQLKLAAR